MSRGKITANINGYAYMHFNKVSIERKVLVSGTILHFQGLFAPERLNTLATSRASNL